MCVWSMKTRELFNNETRDLFDNKTYIFADPSRAFWHVCNES